MKKVNIGLVVRTYDEVGNFTEIRRDHVSCDNIPDEMKKELMAGEVVSVKLMSNVEALYFKVPKDWPCNWTELGGNKDEN